MEVSVLSHIDSNVSKVVVHWGYLGAFSQCDVGSGFCFYHFFKQEVEYTLSGMACRFLDKSMSYNMMEFS